MSLRSVYCFILIFLSIITGCSNHSNEKLEELNKKIKLQPLNSENYYERSKILFESGEANSSLKDINMAVKLDSTNWKYLLRRAAINAETKQLEKAISDYKRLCIYDRGKDTLYNALIARMFIFLDKDDSAIVYGEKSLKSGSMSESLLLNLSYSYARTGNIDKAIKNISHLITITKDSTTKLESLKFRALFQQKRENYRAALEDALKILELIKNDRSESKAFTFIIADCYQFLNVIDSSRIYWEKVKPETKYEFKIFNKPMGINIDPARFSRALDSIQTLQEKKKMKLSKHNNMGLELKL